MFAYLSLHGIKKNKCYTDDYVSLATVNLTNVSNINSRKIIKSEWDFLSSEFEQNVHMFVAVYAQVTEV